MPSKVIVDWFQFSMIKIGNWDSTIFKLKETTLRTKIFAKIQELYYNDILIGSVASEPLSSILDKNLFLFKFENKILYDSLFLFYYSEILAIKCFKFNNLTRIDLCVDFQQFLNNLQPENFILNFLQNKYLKYNNVSFKIQGKQNKFFSDNKKHNGYKIEHNYIRFGSATSNVSVYLYNKTLEIKEASHKSYITQLHTDSGFNMNKDVWRLEFSLKNISCIHLLTEFGELLDFNSTTIFNSRLLVDLFYSLLNNYFKFYKNEYKNKKAKNSELILFKQIKTMYKFRHYSDKHNPTLMAKKFVNMFESFNTELRQNKKIEDVSSSEFLTEFVIQHQLSKWYKNKNK